MKIVEKDRGMGYSYDEGVEGASLYTQSVHPTNCLTRTWWWDDLNANRLIHLNGATPPPLLNGEANARFVVLSLFHLFTFQNAVKISRRLYVAQNLHYVKHTIHKLTLYPFIHYLNSTVNSRCTGVVGAGQVLVDQVVGPIDQVKYQKRDRQEDLSGMLHPFLLQPLVPPLHALPWVQLHLERRPLPHRLQVRSLSDVLMF